jgi:PAS domain S-box-containing protein
VGRLIIVDDEAELMTALCEILTGHGYETVGYTSAAEALAKLKEHDFDLLLTDLMMPEMGGIELLQAALETDPDIVGIVMTGQGTVQTAVEAMKTGAFDYIMKPFKLNSLLPVLSRAMEVRHLRTDNMQLRETVAMHELGQTLAFSSDLNQILNKVTDAALQQCDADEASIMLPTSDGKELIIAVARGEHTEHIGKRIPMGQGIAGWVAQNRKPVTLNGEVHDERFTSINPRTDIRTAVSIPLLMGGSLVGVLNVNITRPHRPFTLGQVKTLNMLVTIVSPILENTRLNLQIREAEERYRSIFDNARDGIALADAETGALVNCNQALCSMVEREETELVGQTQAILHPPQGRIDGKSPTFRSHQEKGAALALEDTLLSKSGALISVEIRAARIVLNGCDYLLGIFRDITERKLAEESLRHAEERYRSVFENAQEGIFRSIPEGKIIMANPAMAKMSGYASPEEMMTSVTDMARQLYVNPEDRKALLNMIEEQGPVKGFETQFYRKDGSIIWIFLTMHAIRDEKGQIIYYDGITGDITNLKQTAERIRKALGATVQAIAVTVEARDPYTAGHQRRVSDLAHAIATEMNLPTDQIDGIRMAAAIHDLGKISVPAEILSKPTKLTDLEFGIIKTHAQSGHDILKDIEFPWPIARMVLEHHERMDGSGYPRNLKEDDILMEARILAVSDVVEAIGSHRPYRPSLGIDAALEEIENNRGTHYDTRTVDACLRIFRENGYQLTRGT